MNPPQGFTKLYRKYVLGETEQKHKNISKVYPNRECNKCGKTAIYGIDTEAFDRDSCPIHDPLTEHPAVLAEKCVEWCNKADALHKTKFAVKLETEYRRDCTVAGKKIDRLWWCLYVLKDIDKLTACMEVWKEMEKDNE
jgi:hypothetical protein